MSGYSVIPADFLNKLKQLIGCKLISVKRYSWWAPEEAVEHGVSKKEIFTLTAGPASIEFDSGAILGFFSDPSLCSVMVWMERDEHGRYLRNETLEADEDLFEIAVGAQEYSDGFWRRIVGSTLVSVSILRRIYTGVRISERPCQVGIAFGLEGGEVFLMAHGLHDNSDDFALLEWSQVLPDIRRDLVEESVG